MMRMIKSSCQRATGISVVGRMMSVMIRLHHLLILTNYHPWAIAQKQIISKKRLTVGIYAKINSQTSRYEAP